MDTESKSAFERGGRLPPWEVGELPQPLPFSVRNAFRVIGPGAILLAASIGGGEWLIGPATVIKHGPQILWLASLAIVLQVLFNLEAIRYTLYTGEPIISGIMRLRPGCRWWGSLYVVLTSIQLGVPALAPACAVTVFAGFLERMPETGDAQTLRWITYGIILITLLVATIGLGGVRGFVWMHDSCRVWVGVDGAFEIDRGAVKGRKSFKTDLFV